jgi:hypothetical protein
VDGIVKIVEEFVEVFSCEGFVAAFVTFGRAVAGELVGDRLFAVGGFVFVCLSLSHCWGG